MFMAASFMFEGLFEKVWSLEDNIFEYAVMFYYNGDRPRVGRE